MTDTATQPAAVPAAKQDSPRRSFQVPGARVARELGYGIRRNITLFVATVITVTISMAQFGGGLLVGEAVNNATQRWSSDIEFIVFMNPEASPEQDNAIRAMVDPNQNSDIRSFTYVDQQGAFVEFSEMFADSPTMVENVTPEILPPSYRVVPVDADADVVRAVAQNFENQPGVKSVVASTEVIRELQQTSDLIRNGLLAASLVLLIAAALLVFNTIRTVIFARRREIEVQKLVGASNWYIRLPFMVEGTLQGVLGGVLAYIPLKILQSRIAGVSEVNVLKLLQGLEVSDGRLFQIWFVLLVVGGLIGAVASLVAITRYLDV